MSEPVGGQTRRDGDPEVGRGSMLAELLRAEWLVVLAVAVGVSAAVVLAIVNGSDARFPDEATYRAAARGLGTGLGYVGTDGAATAARAPGLPILLAPIAALTSSFVVLRLVGVAVLIVALAATWRLADRIGGPTVARLAVGGLALSPLIAYAAGTLYPQTLGMVLVVATVWITLDVDDRLADGRSIARASTGWGAMGGALLLTAPTLVMTSVAGAIWLIGRDAARRSSRRLDVRQPVVTQSLGRLIPTGRVLGTIALGATTCLLVATPWTLRNAVVFDAFVPIQTNAGANLFRGNLEPNAGGELPDDADAAEILDQSQRTTETSANAMLLDAAWELVRDDPVAVGSQYVRKVGRFFLPYDDLAVEDEDGPLRRVVLTATWLPVLALVLMRLALAVTGRWRLHPGETLALTVVVVNVVATAVFVWRVRYRIPFDPLLYIVAAAPVARHLRERSGAGIR